MVVHVVQPNAAIPDESLSPLASSFVLSTSATLIQSVRVDLVIQGLSESDPAFNGDFYAHLTHTDPHGNSAIAMLLNRPGRDIGRTQGYSDNGFQVTFSDTAVQGDIHAYRLTLTGSHATAIDEPGIVTGTWQPDGRAANPDTVVQSAPRSVMLSNFIGMDPNGTWTLSVADVNPGGAGKLVSWGVSITPVPEPASIVAVSSLLLLAWGARRRWERRPGSPRD
jgi:hypothetical protein